MRMAALCHAQQRCANTLSVKSLSAPTCAARSSASLVACSAAASASAAAFSNAAPSSTCGRGKGGKESMVSKNNHKSSQ